MLTRRLSLVFWLFAITSLLMGCFGGSSKQENMPHFYSIDVDRGLVADTFVKKRVLFLHPVKLTSHYKSNQLVFKVGDNQYQLQQGHEFIVDPQDMLTQQLRRWLQKSGLFSDVITKDFDKADMALETAVTAFYGEAREQFSPQSVIEMQFFLTTDDETGMRETLIQTGLRGEVDLDEVSPSAVVKGLKIGLGELLATFESDLSSFFEKRAP